MLKVNNSGTGEFGQGQRRVPPASSGSSFISRLQRLISISSVEDVDGRGKDEQVEIFKLCLGSLWLC